MPQRVFIDLDQCKNKNFKIRSIVDDGSLVQKNTLGVFAAFDNSAIDGYLKDSAAYTDLVLYPIPAKEKVYVGFGQQPVGNVHYRIIDLSGRLVGEGWLQGNGTYVGKLDSGMYVLELYEGQQKIARKMMLKQ